MDPIEVREERVGTTAGAPVAGVTPAGAVAPAGTVAPATAGTGVYASRVGVYPVGYRAIQLVWLIAAVVDIILALDFIFRALKASNTGFVSFIYSIGGPLAAPFDGIFGNTVTNGQYTLRWSDVVAIVIYSIAAWIVVKLVRIATAPRTGARAA